MTLQIIVHPFGVEVYDESGTFLGAITDSRIERGTYAVSDALVSILAAAGHTVSVEKK
jgi:sporulation protein YlmC with PRC-barrel domain